MTIEVKIYSTRADYLTDRVIMNNRKFKNLHMDNVAGKFSKVTWVLVGSPDDPSPTIVFTPITQRKLLEIVAKEHNNTLI